MCLHKDCGTDLKNRLRNDHVAYSFKVYSNWSIFSEHESDITIPSAPNIRSINLLFILVGSIDGNKKAF